ncbi:hypothetical protein RRG08_037293 [Elysia crispata]|uniref:Uncharacterized protein n=1 Tax=Elysia crispata TaxID=231223 RepID=A0AAE1AFT4_9GAST|nr:hypothetical protein RRG08_037293 [Elysia crispata]
MVNAQCTVVSCQQDGCLMLLDECVVWSMLNAQWCPVNKMGASCCLMNVRHSYGAHDQAYARLRLNIVEPIPVQITGRNILAGNTFFAKNQHLQENVGSPEFLEAPKFYEKLEGGGAPIKVPSPFLGKESGNSGPRECPTELENCQKGLPRTT